MSRAKAASPLDDLRPARSEEARAARRLRLFAAASALLLGGCANLGYYLQSVGGQLEIWRRERPIEQVLLDPATPPDLAARLRRVLEIREFATRELALPENGSYRRYADLGRPYAVWNVIATPEFSLEPLRWCFPVAGCVAYRGYFSEAAARRFANELAAAGYDVFVGGVPAYSTLGWFADPVLNTFVRYPETELARLIFHELAHQLVYVRDDTVFNESFAAAVEAAGVERWLARTGGPRAREAFERRQRLRADFVRIVRACRTRLEALYRSGLAPDEMRARKAAILRALREDYRAIREAHPGPAPYDAWFALEVNNAQIASVAIYTDLVPAFESLLAREGGDLRRFYKAVEALARLPQAERAAALRAAAAAREDSAVAERR
jgi:predicted aminopeptidase